MSAALCVRAARALVAPAASKLIVPRWVYRDGSY